MVAEQFHPGKSGPFHPVDQAGAGGDKIGARYLGVGFLREEGHRLVSRYGLGFKDQGAAGGQSTKEIAEHIHRGGAVVDDAHEKDDIKGFGKMVQMFHTQQIDMEVGQARHGVESLEAVIVLDRGLKADHQAGGAGVHTKHIIAVIASHVADHLVGEIGQEGGQPVPLSFTAPFRIDLDTEDGKRAFAPGHELMQGVNQLMPGLCRDFITVADGDRVSGAVNPFSLQGGEGLKGGPIAQETFFVLVDPGLFCGVDVSDPVKVGGGGKVSEIVHVGVSFT